MKTGARIQMIIDYANKVVKYPKGSKGYDPSDMENLKMSLDKYEHEQISLQNGK